MQLGLEVFLSQHVKTYKDLKVGLLTNSTGVNHKLESSIDLFAKHPDIQLTALFGPEHGIRGDAQEGEWVSSTVDIYTNVPIYSLYNENKEPNRDMLQDVDIVFCDLQDIGSRYYTFIYTMANMMELCAKEDKKFVVLDRPNPINGIDVEGNIVETDYRSFVGQFPIPVRHGLTIGELACLFNHEYALNCHVEVIKMEGWTRGTYYDETDLYWVSPTPNATSMNMCLLYPGICLIEGTNISEGRGTTKPFEVIGAPFIDGRKLASALSRYNLEGVLFRPTTFKPTHQKFVGQVCEGVQLHISNRSTMKPYLVGLTILKVIVELYPNQVEFVRSEDFNNHFFLDLLAGTNKLRTQLVEGDISRFIEQIDEDLAEFMDIRKKYLLY